MAYISNHDMKLLKRRRDFLYTRIDNNGEADTGFSYDKAEASALDKVIRFIEAQPVRLVPDGKETAVSD